MTKVISPDSPQYFTETSNESYDRHNYKVIRADGKSVIVDSWELSREIWWNTPCHTLSHIEILDKEEPKGFK